MRRKIFAWVIMMTLVLFYSCSTSTVKTEAKNRIVQQEDGTIALKLDKADCYNDEVNPSINTAEWNVVVSKPGFYKVWLSSATKDTMDLQYRNSVKVSLLDDRIEARPACDKIIQNSSDVSYPYYRADSYMGKFYIKEAGEYNIQVISEKVISNANKPASVADNTKLMSVILTPMTR